MPLVGEERAALLLQLAEEWENAPRTARPTQRCPETGMTVSRPPETVIGNTSKVSWMAKQLEELGETAMSAQEAAQYCGIRTVNPAGTP